MLALTGVAAMYLLGYISSAETGDGHSDGHVEVDSHGNPISSSDSLYLNLEPPFVVNFDHLGVLRYLQASVVVMYPEQQMLDKVREHMPAIRNSLIMLMSHQDFERLNSSQGKNEIRGEMLAAVNDLIHAEEGVGEIFFTNFVMQ